MASALKNFWEPVWNRPHPDQDRINDYLADYDKKIDPDEMLTMTLELVLETITKSRTPRLALMAFPSQYSGY